jgi:Sua5/YciO/YrdC/YwlC family protein/dephospho-CoA kinase
LTPIETKIIKVSPDLSGEHDLDQLRFAAEIIKKGGLVAFPTETVYGLGANALDTDAVEHIFKAKGRPQDNPLILHVSSFRDIETYCNTDNRYLSAVTPLMPGPLTVILPKKDNVPDVVTAGLPNAAIRVPENIIARKLIEYAGVPIAAPSANLSGKPSPTCAVHVIDDLYGKVDLIIDGGSTSVGLESTVVTLCTNPPTLLRPGGVTYEQLCSVFGEVTLSDSILGELRPDEKAAAPGMKYKHYAPKTPVYLLSGKEEGVLAFLRKRQQIQACAILCFEEDIPFLEKGNLRSIGKKSAPERYAKELFDALRKTDEYNNIKAVYARIPQTKTGISLAVYNRLLKASGFHTINTDTCTSRLLTVGVTGPSGSGKGLFSETAKELGYPCIDTDLVARKIVEKGKPALTELVVCFGTEILHSDGSLDRKKLASIAFGSEKSLACLNEITHKYISDEVNSFLLACEKNGDTMAFIDAPVLFDSNIAHICDKTIAIIANKELRLNRIMERDGLSKEDALLRLSAAKSHAFFEENCDYVITNDHDKNTFLSKAKITLHELSVLAKTLL